MMMWTRVEILAFLRLMKANGISVHNVAVLDNGQILHNIAT